MGTTESDLRPILLFALQRFNMYEQKVDFCNAKWSQLNTEFANFCLYKKVISRDDVLTAVKSRIIAIGISMVDQTQRKLRTPPDHVASPHALAFAIQSNTLTEVQLSLLRFDHGDTANTFMQGKVDNLAEDILEQLLAGPPKVTVQIQSHSSDGPGHTCC